MKASELIARLEELMGLHGDLECSTRNVENEQEVFYRVESVAPVSDELQWSVGREIHFHIE